MSNPSSLTNIATYSNFLINYLNKNFFTNFINTLTYHTDLHISNLEIYNFLKQFITNLTHDIKNEDSLNIPKKQYITLLTIVKRLIELKEDTSFSIISYDNLKEHFKINDTFLTAVIDDVISNQIISSVDFQKTFDKIIQDIQIYNQMQVIKSVIYKWDFFITESLSESNNLSALNWVKQFKDTIIEANNGLTELTVLKQSENISDYMMFYDDASLELSMSNIFNYLKTSYKSFKTNFKLLDYNNNGIESSSVTIIAGPSNHAKSIFMLNIAKNMIESYDGSECDTFMFITLEDDINKLFKRLLSIFGNYDSKIVKTMFIKISDILQNTEYKQIIGRDINDRVKDLLDKVTKDAIISITQGKKRLIIKHSNENSFSMSDASRFIDSLEMQGLKVKALFIDYIDVMISSTFKQNKLYVNDEYVTQGLIVHEMRTTSRRYSIPIITITQNNRSAENFQIDMSNSLIGDSAKKIRYGDNIIMIRQREDIDIFSTQVSNDIGLNNIQNNITNSDSLSDFIPFEAKLTKVKDGEKNITKFHIFNKKNLRIYDSIQDVLRDYTVCTEKSEKLLTDLSIIGLNNIDETDVVYDSIDNILI